MIKKLSYIPILFFIWAASLAYATYDQDGENTKSPYFYTADEDVNLPLQHTETFITIDGSIADIKVKQTYINEGASTIEAVYIFPGSTRAAVYGLTIKVNDRITEAVIKEKKTARKEYEQAKSEGKSAALLEQQKPNVFTMSVSNILPGDRIEVELNYTELVQIENNVYELAYPMNVGERYQTSDSSENIELPPQLSDEGKGFSSNISIRLNSAIPVSNISSPSHEIEVLPMSPTLSEISLVAQPHIASRDFVLRYTLSDRQIQTGMLLHEGEDENYFLLQMEPPERIDASSIANREYIFVIDTSGSMHGYPMDISKALITALLESLHSWEKFNVIFFSGNTNVLAKNSLDANAANIKKMKKMLDDLVGNGRTNLLGALEAAEKIKIPESYSRSIITITDGEISVEPEVFRHINEHVGDTNFFSFGIGGYGINRHLIEVIGRAGYGESFIVLNRDDAKRQGKRMLDLIRYPLLTNIEIDFEGFEVYDVQPFYVPDLFANKPLTITGKWKGEAKGKATISGETGAGAWQNTLNIETAKNLPSRALEFIWARREIQQLQDLYSLEADVELEEQITQLGLKHSLLTKFTSFLAIDHTVRAFEENERVVQPQYRSSNGFSLPVLSFSTLASSLVENKSTKKIANPQKTVVSREVSGHIFDLIEGEWVDRNHRITTPVFEISRTSQAFRELSRHIDFLSLLSTDEIYYVTFGSITLMIVNSHFELGEDDLAIIKENIKSHG